MMNSLPRGVSTRSVQITWAAVVSTCILAEARAGGGHGYHSSGGSSSHSYGGSSSHSYGSGYSSGGSGYRSGGSSSFTNFIALVILAVIIYYAWKKSQDVKGNNRFKGTLDPELISGLRRSAPEGSPEAVQLQQKLGEAFVGIQKAWDKGNMDPVRAILSDGVYNRFQIQLEMNRMQGMRNQVEQPTLLGSRILSEDAFGRYVSIDFQIRGRVIDRDIRIDNGSVIKGGDFSVFEEIWSFTRLADAPVTQALQTLGNCPKCAAPLSDAGGSRCSHCGAVLNSGAYDWVLAEITQAVEWAASDRNGLQRYYAELPAVPGEDAKAWLSPQELEDRASVVFIRFHRALHSGSLGALNMFATPELLASLSNGSRPHPQFQLTLGAVDLLGFAAAQGIVNACIRVKFSGSDEADEEGRYQEQILVFSKAIDSGTGKGNLSCMTCPNCGGPIESSDQAKCAYCDNVLSSLSANWVLSGMGGRELLAQLAAARVTAAPVGAAHSIKSDATAQLRILSAVITAALEDRVITASEEATIREFARHFGLGPIFVDMLLKKAKADPAALDETLDMPLAVKWLNNFILVAATDGRITPDEEALLLSFARRQGIEDKQVHVAMKAALKVKVTV